MRLHCQTQASFVCGNCGHTDNADHNAALVIKKRAITDIRRLGRSCLMTGYCAPSQILDVEDDVRLVGPRARQAVSGEASKEKGRQTELRFSLLFWKLVPLGTSSSVNVLRCENCDMYYFDK